MTETKEFEGKRYIEQARALVVTNNETFDLAGAYTEVLNKKIKVIKDYFSPRKAKAKAVHQEWVNAEEESLKPYLEAKNIIHAKLQVYLDKKQEIQDRLNERTKEEAEKAGMDSSLVKVDVMPKGHKRTVYKWKVENFSKVPDEYKLIDKKSLDDLAKKTKGEAKVEGIRFFKSYIAV